MTPKETLQRILEQHNQPSNTPDDVLFNMIFPYCIYKDLAKGSPYSDDGVNKTYVTRCMDISSEIYRSLNFGSKLLVVYEACYSKNEKEEIQFVESCLNGVKKKEAYSFSWKSPHMDETYPAALACNREVYNCTRILYEAENIDVQRLFLEIILSDIGGKYELASKIFIIDTTTGCIFHLFDDRGLWVSGLEGMYFPQLGEGLL
ncbi:DUF3885 domain-containing protein [Lacrimispora algidixylanolytica]|uniref:DUF3885 domain-containing protein n=1 Tax=Lacrimispora algidixylanolytica TaxID=94868 RepID=A0A419T2Y7_9FIRM|nr:hypothetical protein [Lacrimispora algidixylanolytica]RKD31887.1 hypothetical protein BET01_19140 [Lacrimispora algidixylanolytica]